MDDSDIYLKYKPEETKKVKGYVLTKPELGCFSSHMSLWEKCVSLNESIFIIEDNIQVDIQLAPFLEYGIEQIEKFGILKFGAIFNNEYVHVVDVSNGRSIVKYILMLPRNARFSET